MHHLSSAECYHVQNHSQIRPKTRAQGATAVVSQNRPKSATAQPFFEEEPLPGSLRLEMLSEIESNQEDLVYQLKLAEDGLKSIVKANGDKKENLIKSVGSVLNDAKRSLASLDIAIRELDKKKQENHRQELTHYQERIGKISDSLKSLQDGLSSKHPSSTSSSSGLSADEMLLEATRIQKETRKSTHNSLSSLASIQQLGSATHQQLQQDTAQLQRILKSTEEMDNDTRTAQKNVKAIQRKA